MTQIELAAYRMVLKGGTVAQVRETLFTMHQVETALPHELLTDIIAMLRASGVDRVAAFSDPVNRLIGKTQSIELYRAAEELGYLDRRRAPDQAQLSCKVSLFADHLFHTPELERMAVDELYLWLERIVQIVCGTYTDATPARTHGSAEPDPRLSVSAFASCPAYPARKILKALEQMGTSESSDPLHAMDYLFRPKLNLCLLAEERRVRDGDSRAISRGGDPDVIEEALRPLLCPPTVFDLREMLDWISDIAGAASAAVPASPVPVAAGA